MSNCGCDHARYHRCSKHNQKYICLTGPKGVVGSTGPNGSIGPIGLTGPLQYIASAYTSVYNNCISQNINSCNGITGKLVNFNSNSVTNNINFNGTDTLNIIIPGDYEARFAVNAITFNPDGIMSYKMLKNGVTIPGSIYSVISAPTTPVEIVGNVKFNANVNDIIQLTGNNNVATIINSLEYPIGNKSIISGTVPGGGATGSVNSSPINIKANSSVYIIINLNNYAFINSVIDIYGNNYNLATGTAFFNGNSLLRIYYFDNLPETNGYTVTFNIGTIIQLPSYTYNIKTFNIPGTDNPSLGSTGSIVGNALNTYISTITSTTINELALMAYASTGPDTYSTIFPNILLDVTSTTADVAQLLGPIGTYHLTLNSLAKFNSAVISVSIKFKNNSSVCDCPVFSSLDIKLL